jgi:hypothetical protein
MPASSIASNRMAPKSSSRSFQSDLSDGAASFELREISA